MKLTVSDKKQGELKATLIEPNYALALGDDSRAKAEQIVHAVNSHDDLQATISRLKAELEAAEKREKYAISWANRSVDSVKEADDALIAKLKTALGKCAGAFETVLRETGIPQGMKMRFTGRWEHLGTESIKAILDEADALLATPAVSDADGARG